MSGEAAKRKYGGPWQEFRAWIATLLLELAFWVHWRIVRDIALDFAHGFRPEETPAQPIESETT